MCVTPYHWKSKTGLEQFDFPCRKCWACLQNRRNEWTIRIVEECKAHYYNYFVSLTYDDQFVPITESGYYTLSRDDIRDFTLKLHKKAGRMKVRYFLVGEYGSKSHRPHYHCVIFSDVPFTFADFNEVWSYRGGIVIGRVTSDSAAYVVKNHQWSPPDGVGDILPPFQSQSQGIGRNFLKNKDSYVSREKFTFHQNGKNVPIPKYLKKKMFSEEVLRKEAIRLKRLEDANDLLEESKDKFYMLKKDRQKIELMKSKNLTEKSRSKFKL